MEWQMVYTQPDPGKKVFYRYHNSGNNVQLELWQEVKKTPKGYWIEPVSFKDCGHHQWVSDYTKKRFAYPSKEEALRSFIARKKRQILILETQLRNAKGALFQGRQIQDKKQKDVG